MEYINETAIGSGSTRGREPLGTVLLAVTGMVAAVGVSLLAGDHHQAAFGLAAFLCGVAETNGRCGVSHVGMIAPLRDVAPGTWLRCSLGYTVFGLCTAGVVGSGIAAASMEIGLTDSPFLYGGAIVVGAAIVLREIGWLRFPIPQCDRQTNREWFREFGLPTAAAMWGAHIGIGLVTVIKHGGLYLVVALILTQHPAAGACLFAAFWLGRVVVLWVMPWVMRGSTRGDLMAKTIKESSAFNLASAVGAGLGIACSVTALIVG